jgi:hypothetical protein
MSISRFSLRDKVTLRLLNLHFYNSAIFNILYRIMTNSLYSHRKSSIVYKHLSKWQPYNISVPLDLKVTCDTRLIQNIIYVWKLNQTVLELDFWAVKFLFFLRRDLNLHIYMKVGILFSLDIILFSVVYVCSTIKWRKKERKKVPHCLSNSKTRYPTT